MASRQRRFDAIANVMFDARWLMRTTLSLDDDVLDAARALARQRGVSVGEVISGLARAALRTAVPSQTTPKQRSGLPLLASKAPAAVVDLQLVNQLRDESV